MLCLGFVTSFTNMIRLQISAKQLPRSCVASHNRKMLVS